MSCEFDEWKNVKFMIFDCLPTLHFSSSTELFEQRIQIATERLTRLKSAQDTNQSNVEVVKMQQCTGFSHMYAVLSEILEKVEIYSEIQPTILKKGGKGLMLRKPNSKYDFGCRSFSMLKFQVFR